MQSTPFIQIKDILFKYPSGDELFSDVNLSVLLGDKIALIGPNGSGKSTLLKIILGEISPTLGLVQKFAGVSYVPQNDLALGLSDETLFSYLSSKREDWWLVLSTLEKHFNVMFEPTVKISTLSGGELMKLNLAQALADDPEVLLLDEPSNHLDLQSLQFLAKFLSEFKGSYLIVSHDTSFVDQVASTIWEIDNKNIKVYGGNYSSYKEQKQSQLDAKKRRYLDGQEQLKHISNLASKEQQRASRSAKQRRTAFLKGSLSSFEYIGGERGKPSASSSHQKKIKKLQTNALDLITENEVIDRKLAFVKLKATDDKSQRTLINLSYADLYIKDNLLLKDINLRIIYGDRICIAGANGSGKSSLIKTFMLNESKDLNISGENYLAENLKCVYIDQHYKLINSQLNLIENIISYNNDLSIDIAKQMLGKLQFKTESDMLKKANKLSGGELARLAFAMTTSTPLDLLMLDEPTNNLDIQTVDVLIQALNNYHGALIVISHNIDFLSQININKSYRIERKRLYSMFNLPSDKDGYIREILEKS